MQCALCNKPLIVNAEESSPFSEGDFVTIPLSIPGIHPIFEIWERYICKSCTSVHYRIKLVSSEEKIPLPRELICPEQRLTLENCSVQQRKCSTNVGILTSYNIKNFLPTIMEIFTIYKTKQKVITETKKQSIVVISPIFFERGGDEIFENS